MDRNWWMAIVSAVTVVLFAGLASALYTNPAIALDNGMVDLLEGNRVLGWFTMFGDVRFIAVLVFVAALILFLKRNWTGLVFLVLSLGGGTVLNQGLKQIFGRQRPDIADQLTSFSFPSGHSQMSFLYLATIAVLLAKSIRSQAMRRVIWIAAGVLIVLVGASRIALGRHFATDVLGGWLLAAAWLFLLLFLFGKAGRRRRHD